MWLCISYSPHFRWVSSDICRLRLWFYFYAGPKVELNSRRQILRRHLFKNRTSIASKVYNNNKYTRLSYKKNRHIYMPMTTVIVWRHNNNIYRIIMVRGVQHIQLAIYINSTRSLTWAAYRKCMLGDALYIYTIV